MNVRFYLSYDIKIALKSHFYRKNVIILSLLFFFYLILYVPLTIFQLNMDRSSWVEPVLS